VVATSVVVVGAGGDVLDVVGCGGGSVAGTVVGLVVVGGVVLATTVVGGGVVGGVVVVTTVVGTVVGAGGSVVGGTVVGTLVVVAAAGADPALTDSRLGGTAATHTTEIHNAVHRRRGCFENALMTWPLQFGPAGESWYRDAACRDTNASCRQNVM
jgi:hypothetical protein